MPLFGMKRRGRSFGRAVFYRWYSNVRRVTPVYFFNGLVEVKKNSGSKEIVYDDGNKFVLDGFQSQLLKSDPIFVDEHTVKIFLDNAPRRYQEAERFFAGNFGIKNPIHELNFTAQEIKNGVVKLADGTAIKYHDIMATHYDWRPSSNLYYVGGPYLKKVATQVFIEQFENLFTSNFSEIEKRWRFFDTGKGVYCFAPKGKNKIRTNRFKVISSLKTLAKRAPNSPSVEWALHAGDLISCIQANKKTVYIKGHGSNAEVKGSCEPIVAGLAESTLAKILNDLEQTEGIDQIAFFSCFTCAERIRRIHAEHNKKALGIDILTATATNKKVYNNSYENILGSCQDGRFSVDEEAPSFSNYFETMSKETDRCRLTWKKYLEDKDPTLFENMHPSIKPQFIKGKTVMCP